MPPFDKQLIVHQEMPFNGGPPAEMLCESPITPIRLFYVRNHGTVPTIDAARYRLTVRGEKILSLSLDELQQNFAQHTLTTTLQCAGNRRRELLPDADPKEQVMWGTEAISTAEWTGVRLADVLRAAGVPVDVRHAAFTGLDECEKDGETFGFGGSIPIEKALHPEVLLAFSMNGQVLPPVHGFPLRVIAPGYVAARSVKWLAEINLQTEPSSNYFQQQDYKLFPPDVTAENVDWTQGEMLGELNLNAVICSPSDETSVQPGRVHVAGYAVASGDHVLQGVEVSSDGGRTWTSATLDGEPQQWVWQLWHTDIKLASGKNTLVVRATDSSGTTQPPNPDTIWNFRGYMNNAWHKITVFGTDM